MWRFILSRLFIIFLALFFLSIFLFALVRIIPGSPEMVILLKRGGHIDTQKLNAINEELGLNLSLLNQYVAWANNIVSLDFGVSYQSNLPVLKEIFSRIGNTFVLIACSLTVSSFTGIIIAFYAAIYNSSRLDRWISTVSIILSSIPNYLIGLLLVLLFSIHLKITPVYGNNTWVHFILPVLTACIPLSAISVPLYRRIIGDIMESVYFEAAKALGLKNIVLYGKILFLPCIHGFLTVIASHIGSLWGGIIVIETIYSWPGLGNYIIHAVSARDYPVIIGFTLIMSFFTMFIYLLIDLLLRHVDPRQNFEKGKTIW